jgi:hypothetical protein
LGVRITMAETVDLATKLPDVLHSLKARYLELRATAYDQITPIRNAYKPENVKAMNALYTAALKKYGGFQGPFWGLDDDDDEEQEEKA